MIPNCTKSSILYENVCLTCNPGAKERRSLVEVKNDVPSLYIGGNTLQTGGARKGPAI